MEIVRQAGHDCLTCAECAVKTIHRVEAKFAKVHQSEVAKIEIATAKREIMRDIKYQGWDSKSLKEVKRIHFDGDGHTVFWSPSSANNPLYQNCEKYPLREFTGLHDKNDKEIYEGDIVTYGTEDAVVNAIVEFAEENSEESMFLTGFKLMVINSADYPDKEEDNDYTLEVIGNIYENPKSLLEGK